VHFAVALLAAFGLDRLCLGLPGSWRRASLAWMVPGVLLLAVPLLPWVLPDGVAWFLAHFFPPGIPATGRPPLLAEMFRDAATGGLLCTACAVLAAVVAAGRLLPARATVLVVVLVGGDLLRTGAGLNPMVAPEVLRVSPEVVDLVSHLPGRQRLYTCDAQYSPAYWRARAARTDHEVFTFATWMDTLAPNYNMSPGIATALSEDLTSLVPSRATPRPGQSCRDVAALVPALRHAAVTHVLSLDPLTHPDLDLVATLPLRRVAPLVLQVYALREPTGLAALVGSGGRVSLDLVGANSMVARTVADAPATLLIHSGFAPGWRAWVSGRPAPLFDQGGHLGVAVPAGPALVQLRYSPPGLFAGLALAALSLGVLAWLWRTSPRPDATRDESGEGGPS
jgi:hypothetical protein